MPDAIYRRIYGDIDEARRNRTADRFELTGAQYNALVAGDSGFLAMNLEKLIRAFDFDRRQIIGVPGSLAPSGMRRWHEQWDAQRDQHMKRAWAAFYRADDRWGDSSARAAESYVAGAIA